MVFVELQMLCISSDEAESELLSITASTQPGQFFCQKEIISLIVQGVLYAIVKNMLLAPMVRSRLMILSVLLTRLSS